MWFGYGIMIYLLMPDLPSSVLFFFENRLQPTPYCGEVRAIANLVNVTEGSIAYIPTPLNVTTNI